MALRYKSHDFLDATMEEALKEYTRLKIGVAGDVERTKKVRRELCQQDLFYLLVGELGRYDMCHPWLYRRCREVQRNPDEILDLWAREHYKSTIITYGHTIMDILNNPEQTICIFSHSGKMAKKFLKPIKETFESNLELLYLFSDILYPKPRSQSPLWSVQDGLLVRRQCVRKEPTLYASGLVDSMPTGMHFDIRVYDDMVDRDSVNTPDQIEKTTECWVLSSYLGTETGVARYIGTRYHLHDTYSTMQERGIPTRVYPCTSDGTDDVRKTVLKSAEYLAKKRKEDGIYQFSCQMLLNPLADNVQGFKEEWLMYWNATNDKNLNKIIIVDPASGKRANQAGGTRSTKQANKDNDYTAMWVIGIGGDDNFYILDIVRDRLNLTQRTEMLLSLHRQWRPRRVGYEEYGMQADIEHIEYVQEEQNYRFKIWPLGGAMAKPDRIKRLVPIFESQRIFLPTSVIKHDYEGKAVDLVRVFKEDEYCKFPVLKHDDMLDSLSRIADEDMRLLPPAPQEYAYKAIREHRREMRRRRPVV